MKIDVRPRKRNAPRPAEKSAPGFLQWLRGRPCVVDRPGCQGKIEAAHVDYAGGKGMGTKVADRFAVPMCSAHHALQHSIGWASFERHHMGGEGRALRSAEIFWRFWPGRAKWEAKQQ